MAKEKKEVVEGTGHEDTCVCLECRTFTPKVEESK